MRGILFGGGAVPALDLNFAGTLAIPAIGTFARTGIATYFDSAGVLQAANANVARFTYDPLTHESLGYFPEEARTNIQIQSQLATGWSSSGGVLVPNNVLSLDGTSDGATFTEDTTTGVHYNFGTAAVSIAANSVYTVSAFFKAGTSSLASIGWFGSGDTNGVRADIDLTAKTISAGTAVGLGVVAATGIDDVGGGWLRAWIAGTIDTTSTSGFFELGTENPLGTVSFAGTSRTLKLFGAQVELGQGPTSYIPTTTVAVARGADALTIPISSTIIPAAPSTLSIITKFRAPSYMNPAKSYCVYQIDDGTAGNRILHRFSQVANTPLQLITQIGGVSQLSLTEQAVATLGITYRAWVALQTLNTAAQVIGQTKLTNISATPLPSGLTSIKIGNASNAILNGPIARFSIFNPRLQDAQATALSSTS